MAIKCKGCAGRGFILADNDVHGLRIERCDTCEVFSGDQGAVLAVFEAACAHPPIVGSRRYDDYRKGDQVRIQSPDSSFDGAVGTCVQRHRDGYVAVMLRDGRAVTATHLEVERAPRSCGRKDRA